MKIACRAACETSRGMLGMSPKDALPSLAHAFVVDSTLKRSFVPLRAAAAHLP